MNRKLVTPLGTAAWSAVVTPRENRFNGRPEWVLGLEVDEAAITDLLQQLEQLIATAAQRDPAFANRAALDHPIKPSTKKDQMGNQIPVPGKVVINAKRAAQRMSQGQATPNQPPILYDALGQLAQGVVDVPHGSKVKMIVEAYSYNKAGRVGIGLDLCGVQIGQLAENMPELSPIEGMDAPVPPVGVPAIAPPPVAAAPAWQPAAPAPVAAPPAQWPW
jgi:hypothetical protein